METGIELNELLPRGMDGADDDDAIADLPVIRLVGNAKDARIRRPAEAEKGEAVLLAHYLKRTDDLDGDELFLLTALKSGHGGTQLAAACLKARCWLSGKLDRRERREKRDEGHDCQVHGSIRYEIKNAR